MENITELKNVKLWNHNQAKNTQLEIWQGTSAESHVFKVEKQEDTLRRKFFLRPLKNPKVKEYLSEMKYKEKLMTFARKTNDNMNPSEESNDEEETKKFEVIRKPINKKETSFSYLRESINSIFQENVSIEGKKISMFSNYFEENVSKDIVKILQNKRKKQHFLLKDNENFKPILQHLSVKSTQLLENPIAIEFKYKCFTEKSCIKGAVWGQLIILKNSLIFVSLNDERPDDDPIFWYFF